MTSAPDAANSEPAAEPAADTARPRAAKWLAAQALEKAMKADSESDGGLAAPEPKRRDTRRTAGVARTAA